MTPVFSPETVAHNSEQACRRARLFLNIVLGLCGLTQVFIEASLANLVSTIVATSTSYFVLNSLIRPEPLQRAPLPTLVVVGFNVSTLSGALVGQTIYLLPLSYELEVPVFTFGAAAGVQLSLWLALFAVRESRTAQQWADGFRQRFVLPLGVFRAPSAAQLWLMGFIGILALLVSSGQFASGGSNDTGILAKVMQAMRVFSNAPFLIPLIGFMLPTVDNRLRKPPPGTWAWLGAYFMLLIVIAMIMNARTVFALSLTSMAIVMTWGILLGNLKLSRRGARSIVAGGLLLALSAPVFSDLATAMLIARSARDTASAGELIDRTLNALDSPEMLEEYVKQQEIVRFFQNYNEHYNPNPYISRLVVTKFIDNGLSLRGVQNGDHSEALGAIMLDRAIAVFPTPVLHFFGSDIDKNEISFTSGDAMFFVEHGHGLTGNRVGITVATVRGVAGSWVYVLMFVAGLWLFFPLLLLTSRQNGLTIISPLIALISFQLVHLAAAGSLAELFQFVLRVLPQFIVFYALMFFATDRFLRLFGLQPRTRDETQLDAPAFPTPTAKTTTDPLAGPR